MADPVVHITGGIPDAGTGNITTLGQTLLDGANITLGAVADAAVVAGAAGTVNAHLRSISRDLVGGIPVTGTFWPVTQPVSGTFWQATQPVSGTFWQATQPVSGTVAVSGTTTVTGTVAATQSGTWTVQQGTPPWSMGGDVANAATDAGNPVKIGGIARTANPTAVTAGQRVNAMFDKSGKQVTTSALRELKGVQKTSITSGSETTVVTAGAAGVFNDVYAILVTNKSATAVFVDFKDATAGTTRMTIAAPASDTRGFTVTVDSAMVQATAANNWTATVSAAVTSIEITMLYVSNV